MLTVECFKMLCMDCWFFHHPAVIGAHKVGDLAEAFGRSPSGNTPILSTLDSIYEAYKPVLNQGVPVLLLIISDGEPSDGSIGDLEWKLREKHRDLHVSFIEANDNEEEMCFMDGLDSRVTTAMTTASSASACYRRDA
jgi:hypothetical protein